MQILLSTPHWGFSETMIKIIKKKNTQRLLINNYWKLFTYKIHDVKNWFKRKAFILGLKMIGDSLNLKWGFKAFHKVTIL